jgi:tRNA threonylcarbamoyladenosine dehydratase
MDDFEIRFGGLRRLYGNEGAARLRRAHVGVFGIGGVGCWAVEALARSGLGELTLVDLDEVCVSNVNRQIHALAATIGQSKVEVMAERVRAISPDCRVQAIQEFFTASSAETLLQPRYDFVFDVIDQVSNKCLLIALCREKKLPLITSGGAGGRRDPGAIRVADLAFSTHDRLLQVVRKKLRDDFGFPQDLKQPFGMECVYSRELAVYPHSDGTVCARPEPGADVRLDCESGYGTAAFVTGAFGFAGAARIVSAIALGNFGTRTQR